jgi:hypothetical protein
MSVFNVGDTVRVLAPFTESFPEVYVVTEVVNTDDDGTVYILGDRGGFDAVYLEASA